MNISLPIELEKMVQDKVKQGFYSSASEVIREALRLLLEKEILQKQRIEKLNIDIQKGLDAVEKGQIVDGPQAMNDILDRHNK